MKDVNEMTVMELKQYVNSLSNEEIAKLANEYDNDEIDVIELLDAAKLYDYMQWNQKDDFKVEL